MSSQNNTIKKPVRILGYLLIGSLLLLLFALIGEIIARQDSRYARPAYEYDPQLIWRLKRNHCSPALYAMGKIEPVRKFELRFNKSGFRGPNFSDPSDKTRIVILGDSYTAGLDYPEEDLFTSLLENQLNKGSSQFEVLNVSCPAWGTDQQYIYWINEGLQLQADYLILMMSPNDIRETYNKRLCTIEDDGQLKITKAHIPFVDRWGWKLANWSSLYQFMQHKWFYTRYGNFMRMYQYFPVHYGQGDSLSWDMPLFAKDTPQEVEASYQLIEQLLIRFQKSCATSGTVLLIGLLPAKIEFDGRLNNTSGYEAGSVASRLTHITQKHALHFSNLYQKALTLPNDPAELYISWEFHFNKEGHIFVARELAKLLKAELRQQ